MLTTRLGGHRGPPVVGTIQSRKVLIPKQVFPMLGQIAVDRLPTHVIQVDLIRRKNPTLRERFPIMACPPAAAPSSAALPPGPTTASVPANAPAANASGPPPSK